MLAALAHPRSPAVLVPAGASTRVEISLGREVLVLYQAGHVALISHVSNWRRLLLLLAGWWLRLRDHPGG